MADIVYSKITPLTDKDELSVSPYSVDELLAEAAAKADASLKRISDRLKRFRDAQIAPVPQPLHEDIIRKTIEQIEKEKNNMAAFNFGGMSKFERQMREKQAEEAKKREEEQKLAEEEARKAEEWIWVEGYKGTNKDMTCRDYQFELNKQFDMPEGADIEDCKSGFHFCKDLKDVFDYYSIGNGHRFFRVRALVRKKDYEEYGKEKSPASNGNSYYYIFASLAPAMRDKLAAKSIQFLYELTPDEVFAPLCNHDKELLTWTTEEKRLAMEQGINYVKHIERVNTLVSLGYSDAFATYLVDHSKYEKAYAVGTQTDLSMDMKVLMILKG